MSTTSFPKSYRGAVIVTEDFLRRIAKLVEDQQCHPKFEVRLSDSVMDSLDLSQLLDLKNSSHRQILGMKMRTKYDDPLSVRLEIERTGIFETPISYNVTGNDKEATYVQSELISLIRSVLQPYSILWKNPAITICMVLIFILVLIFISLNIFFDVKMSILIALLSTAFILFPAMFLVAILLNWLYPNALFDIGDGSHRIERLRARRIKFYSFVFSGIFLPFAVGIAVAHFYDSIFGAK